MDTNKRVLPHVCSNIKCRILILPPFTKSTLCDKCRKEKDTKIKGE